MKQLLAFLLTTLLLFNASAVSLGENDAILLPFGEGELWGYCNTDGEVVHEAQWATVGWFRENLAVVATDYEHYGIIDMQGKYLLPCEYFFIEDTWGGDFSPSDPRQMASFLNGKENGFFLIMDQNGLMGFYSIATQTFVEPQWTELTIEHPDYANNELFPVYAPDSGWGYVDWYGNLVIPYNDCLSWCEPFTLDLNGEYAYVWVDNDQYLMDKQGNLYTEEECPLTEKEN